MIFVLTKKNVRQDPYITLVFTETFRDKRVLYISTSACMLIFGRVLSPQLCDIQSVTGLQYVFNPVLFGVSGVAFFIWGEGGQKCPIFVFSKVEMV